MSRRFTGRAASLALLCLLAGRPARGQDAAESAPLVERVEIRQNQFLPKETLLFYVSTKAGDRYDEMRLKDDFRRLWNTGFLEDLLVSVADGKTGKIVTFTVREQKRIQIIDYTGSKELTKSTIEDKLKEKDATIRVDTFYDLAKIRHVEQVIRDLLDEKGRRFGSVKHDVKTVGGSGLQLTFIIDDGPKVKITEIDFKGNKVFKDGQLRGAMKKLKPSGFWNLSWLGGKSTYTEAKWAGSPEDPRGDRGRLEDYFLNRGYVTATVGEPEITISEPTKEKKPKATMKIVIPVTEGDQYRVGEVKFEGLTVFKEESIRPIFKLKTGDVYDDSKLKKGFEKIRDAYGSQGYFQATGLTKRTPDAQRKVVDVTLSMDEDKRYFVGRIKFTGNETTRDKVIRREVYLNEGEVFNTEALKLSIKKINQLGYFKPMEGAPDLAPSPLGEDKLDVTFKVQEQNRNQFTFGGGVSGLEGVFLNASFQTANFLGLGETLQLSAQKGARAESYQIGITEPYFLDRPITAGFDVFKRRIEYQTYANVVGYTERASGLNLIFGRPVGRFSRVFLNYTYQVVDIENLTAQEQANLAATTPLLPTTTAPVYDPFFFGQEGKQHQSTLGPSIVYNTVDNPWTPHAGKKITLSSPFTGGPLGGTLNFYKPDIEAIFYIPHTRRSALGIRGQFGYILPFGDTATVDPKTGRNGIPLYQRFFLGGEQQIRGYDIRAVGPVDPYGRALGGNKYALFNAEYYIDLVGPLRLVLFFDAGQAYLEGQPVNVSQFKISTGPEIRLIMPVLNVPFRLIYAFNPNNPVYVSPHAFKFAVGTTF